MKKLKWSSVAVATCLINSFFLTGCQKADTDTQQQKVEKLLATSSWVLQKVSVDGTDQTATYAGLTLAFTATGYTSTHGNAVWPASDTWSFTDATATAFTRSDGLTVTISQIDQSQLTLELTWAKSTFVVTGRTTSISGKHVFVFKHP